MLNTQCIVSYHCPNTHRNISLHDLETNVFPSLERVWEGTLLCGLHGLHTVDLFGQTTCEITYETMCILHASSRTGVKAVVQSQPNSTRQMESCARVQSWTSKLNKFANQSFVLEPPDRIRRFLGERPRFAKRVE
jgi:hypothetical protein